MILSGRRRSFSDREVVVQQEGTPVAVNTLVAHIHPFIIGADTHARTHTLAVLTAAGQLLATETFPNTGPGRARAVDWAARRTGGDLEALWAIEGVGAYGAQLARAATSNGYQVAEAARMPASDRHGVGKSDPLDARRIAATVLTTEVSKLRHPRQDDGIRAAAQILLTARDQLTAERTRAANALTALLRIIDLGVDARRSLNAGKIAEIARWRTRDESIALASARTAALRLAKRIIELDTELGANNARIRNLVLDSPAADLLDKTGIGPVTAATVLAAWSHPGRLRNEAAFASLAGVNPIPASSGNTVRHRLNRGGDRRLNRALNVIAMVRIVHDPDTRAYAERRRIESKTDREIRRCLKRYLARAIYRHLNTAALTTTQLDER